MVYQLYNSGTRWEFECKFIWRAKEVPSRKVSKLIVDGRRIYFLLLKLKEGDTCKEQKQQKDSELL